MLEIMLTLIILSAATAGLSMTISKSKITLSLRNYLIRNIPWLGELLSCPYCVSHWVAAIFVIFLSPLTIPFTPIITIFAIVAISTIVEGLMFQLFFDQESEIERLRTALSATHEAIKLLTAMKDKQ